MNGKNTNNILGENDLDFNRPEFIANPYPIYERLRMLPGPVYSEFEHAWIVSRHDEAAQVLRDKRLSNQQNFEINPLLKGSFTFQDPPEHTYFRNIFQESFSPKSIMKREKQIEIIADRLIDNVIEKKRMNLLEDFARVLPVVVISDMLGIPSQDQEQMKEWTMAIAEDSPQANLMRAKYLNLNNDITTYFLDLFDRIRANTQDSLLKVLLNVYDNDSQNLDNMLISNCLIFFIAGFETTMHLLGNAVYLLLDHSEQLAKLKANPELMTSAIEEILRFESPLRKSVFRTVTEPVEIGGKSIAKGERIVVLLGSANRDPSVFTNPNHFNIERTPNRHLAFGTGIHACLAATLARMEGRIGIQKLFQRLPDLRLASEVQPVQQQIKTHFLRKLFVKKHPAAPVLNFPIWTSSSMVRGLSSLPLEW